MKRRITVTALLFTAAAITALAETKKFVFDCEAWPEGEPPKEVFVVDGSIMVKAVEGGKALEIGIDPLVDANALVGDSANGSARIEVRALASKAGRSYPRFGIGVHGQSGYRLMVFPAKKELQLTKGDEVVKAVPFEWTSDAWVRLKLEVKKVAEGRWTITGKAWADKEEEPKEAQITHEDATLKGQGKCSIWGAPYAGTPIYFDDVKVEVD